MSDKKYKITTVNKEFLSDTLGSEYLKKEGNTFFARENLFDKWERIINIKEKSGIFEHIFSPLNKLMDIVWNANNPFWGLLFGVFICMPLGYICFPFLIIDFLLPHLYVELSASEIEKLIERNKPYTPSISYTSGGYRSGGSSGGRSYSSGGYSGGSGASGHSTSSAYVSSTDMNNALKTMKEKGLDGKTLATYKDEEREKLFIEHFGDEEKGKIASDRFNRTYIYPARKDILTKLINEEEFEDNSIKTNLLDKVKSFDGAISKDEFEGIVREIVTFKEKKKRIDNHVKYEGRLSNKDIQAIKEHLGYICMACGLNPAEEYGENMKGIMEAHHKKPYAEIEAGESRTVEPDDFLILCPTCHRLIHKLGSPNDLDGLKELVNKPIRSSWWD